MNYLKNESDQYWREKLTPAQYRVLRQKGTEPAGTGEYNKHCKSGMYICAGCGAELFLSETKFDSGTGWPSFSDADTANIELEDDRGIFMKRVEVLCKQCGGHLGHVFDDGPKPTGKRYCINSAALNFTPQ